MLLSPGHRPAMSAIRAIHDAISGQLHEVGYLTLLGLCHVLELAFYGFGGLQ